MLHRQVAGKTREKIMVVVLYHDTLWEDVAIPVFLQEASEAETIPKEMVHFL